MGNTADRWEETYVPRINWRACDWQSNAGIHRKPHYVSRAHDGCLYIVPRNRGVASAAQVLRCRINQRLDVVVVRDEGVVGAGPRRDLADVFPRLSKRIVEDKAVEEIYSSVSPKGAVQGMDPDKRTRG